MLFQFISFLLLVAWQQESVTGLNEHVHLPEGLSVVKLANGGLVSGITKLSRNLRPYNAFIGIPFATVPERFHEPVPINKPPWIGVLPAITPGHMCVQGKFGDETVGQKTMGKEDCLNLNVFVPMNITLGGIKTGHPVMVFIYGGGYMFGTALGYGPKFFMDSDVVVVTIQYRLGVFGFLSTGDSVVPGNNGLKDQVVALRWVQENIKAFGGDPTKVTIFGESAGGASVHHLMLSPITKGLFHRAISQSGSALSMWAYDPKPRDTAVELATFLKCKTTAGKPEAISSEEILTCFRGLTTEELNKAQFTFRRSFPSNMRSFYFAPTVEPSGHVSSLTPFQTEPPISILTRKDSNLPEIPWMVGANEDEGASMYAGVVLENPEILKEMNANWEKVAPSTFDYDDYLGKEGQHKISEKFKKFYFGDKNISVEEGRIPLTNLYSDELVLYGVYKSAIEMASKRNQVYLYEFAYKGPLSMMGLAFHIKGEDTKKVGHGDELQHLFDFSVMMPAKGPIIKPGTPDEEFSKHFVKLWVSFAVHGEPTYSWGNGKLKTWKAISKAEVDEGHPMKWYRIDANPSEHDISPGVKDRMKFWVGLWTEHFTPAVMANGKSQG